MFAGHFINNTCFTYMSIMINCVVSNTIIGVVTLVSDLILVSQNLNVKS
jgi:hypothetical protein